MIFKIFIVLTVLLFSATLISQESPQAIQAYRDEPYGNALYKKKGIMDGNLVRTMYFNQAEVGHWPDQPSGEWPKGTGHSYLDGVCLLVGTKLKVVGSSGDTLTITPMEAAYREWMDVDPITGELWGWEPVPGYVEPSSEKPAISSDPKSWPTLWPNAIFTYLNVSPSLWQNVPELEGETGVDDDGDGVLDNYTYWYGYFGRGVKNADLETFFVMDDSRDGEWARLPYNYFPIAEDHNRKGLGLRVETRGFQWSHVLAEDNIFWHYDIVNISDTTYTESVFGFLTDVGIGGTDDSGDDNASFDRFLDLAYGYDNNGLGSPGLWGPTGYMGYAYLESPGNPFNNIDDDEDGLVDERRDDGIDNDGDWTPFTDLNGNGVWDADENEPLNDDLGKDGVGPFDRQYNGPDEGEGDGVPTEGEPAFDRTDIDESDMIGLTSVSIYRLIDGGGGNGWPRNDEGLYNRMSYLNFDTTLQNSNIHLLFGSGPFELKKDHRERFSMALLFGSDLEDLTFNKITVQEIYNANYNFARPPLKPFLKIVSGDGKVFLYWDEIAEESRDPFLQDSIGNPRKDFEGYLIYRSKEPEFQDIKIVTDSKGEPKYWKPIAQFDLKDGITGPDPVGINGARFWRGNDTGLRHSYVDDDVINGQRYYYAVVSYDQGDPEKGEIGLQPSECTKIINEDFAGNLKFVDINCGVVTPNAPAAGYIAPQIEGNLNEVSNGIGSGSINIEIINPLEIEGGKTYKIEFGSTGNVPTYETDHYNIYRMDGDSSVLLESFIDAHDFGDDYPSPPVDGLVVNIYNDTTVEVIPQETGWLIGNSNLDIRVKEHTNFTNLSQPWPADYKITFFDTEVDTSYNFKIPAKFKIWNLTDDREAQFEIWDRDNSKSLTIGDSLTIIEFIGTSFRFAFDVTYFMPLIPGQNPIEPQPGDEFIIRTSKPFYTGDYFLFTTKAASTDNQIAQQELSRIKVVPNPYILGASWERRTLFSSGRGERKIDFIHLPDRCTIRVFTLSGALVTKIEHNSPVLDGSESWNLISDDGMEIAYGVYIYHIDAPGVGKYIGKFAVIK
jgi:hypothetical protein